MSDQIPTTEEVAQDAIDGFEDRGGSRAEGGFRFDRWLAAHTAEAERRGAVKALRGAAYALREEGSRFEASRLRDRADRLEKGDE